MKLKETAAERRIDELNLIILIMSDKVKAKIQNKV